MVPGDVGNATATNLPPAVDPSWWYKLVPSRTSRPAGKVVPALRVMTRIYHFPKGHFSVAIAILFAQPCVRLFVQQPQALQASPCASYWSHFTQIARSSCI